MPASPHSRFRLSLGPRVRVWIGALGWVFVGTSVLFAALLWIQLASEPFPYFGNPDQWVETPDIISQPFLEMVLAGHNGVPTYIQNALAWLDYHWLDYTVLLPRLFVFIAWPVGSYVFHAVLRRAGLSRRVASLVFAFAITLWIADVNGPNLVPPWRAMESTGIWMLFSLATGLLLGFRSEIRDQGIGTVHHQAWFLGATACAWSAFYLHGGLAVLPIVIGLAALSTPRSRSRLLVSALILGVFLAHYHVVHTMPPKEGLPHPLTETFFGYLISMSSLAYVLVVPYVGHMSALVTALTISAAALIVTGVLCWYLVRSRISDADVVALALLAYATVLTLAVTIATIRPRGWISALTPRYLSYSIYTLLGLSVAIGSRMGDHVGLRRLRSLPLAAVVMMGLIAGAAWRNDIRQLWDYRQRQILNESAGILYTLEPWNRPDMPYFVLPRQTNAVRASHDSLLAARKFVFSTNEFATFDRLRRQGIEEATPTCSSTFAVTWFMAVASANGRPVEVRFTWRDFGSNVASMFLLMNESRVVGGWALGPAQPERRIELTSWIDWFIHDGGRVTFRGFAHLPEGARTLRIAPIAADGRPMCVSDVLRWDLALTPGSVR